jgi:hypothetical protein
MAVDCVLTNTFIAFWVVSIFIGLGLGYLARGREVDRLQFKIENLNSLITSLRRNIEQREALTSRNR